MLRTERLLLRPWCDDDFEPYAALNADPEVRRWWADGTLSRSQSDKQAAFLRQHVVDHGFGFWAVEVPDVAPFIGFVGLQHVPDAYHFAPAVEIGWRLARRFWGHDYASEAASAALTYGFKRLGLSEIVAFAPEGNAASRRVMERIGMLHKSADDFDDPKAAANGAWKRNVLYRIGASAVPDKGDPCP